MTSQNASFLVWRHVGIMLPVLDHRPSQKRTPSSKANGVFSQTNMPVNRSCTHRRMRNAETRRGGRRCVGFVTRVLFLFLPGFVEAREPSVVVVYRMDLNVHGSLERERLWGARRTRWRRWWTGPRRRCCVQWVAAGGTANALLGGTAKALLGHLQP